MSAREEALAIYRAALEAVRPAALIARACRLEGDTLYVNETSYDLGAYRRIFVFGSGKAAGPMAAAVEALLGERIASGLVVVPAPCAPLRRIAVMEGAHPVPDARSVAAGKRLLEAMGSCGEEDFYLYLLSGGSSALIELPQTPITLSEMAALTRLMLENALEISRINTVRKHVSALKGGRLGTACPATGAVLAVSDVIGDDLEAIGSAPLYRDRTTFEEARRILEDAGIYDRAAPSVRTMIDAGCRGELPESPKTEAPRIRHYIVGSNTIALDAAAAEAAQRGYAVGRVVEPLSGDAEAAGVAMMRRAADETALTGAGHCTLYGGETTVEVRGNGRGGRNQQLCLAALQAYPKGSGITLLCAGTDGIDGNSHAAGACIDEGSLLRAAAQGLDVGDYLRRNDATAFFEQTGDLIVTGPSGTNVMDVAVALCTQP